MVLKMTYKTHIELRDDIFYLDQLKSYSEDREHFRHDSRKVRNRSRKDSMKMSKMWEERIEEKYEQTKKSRTRLGRFLTQFPIPLKEFRLLLHLIEGETAFRMPGEYMSASNAISYYGVRFESSMLKKFKLVYKIVKPDAPMKEIYQLSYKAQLMLKSKKYTEEYEQLDMALEDESKRSDPDEMDGLYYAIKPKQSFKDLIIDEKTRQQLMTAKTREEKKDKIMTAWEFGRQIGYGRGTTLNFRGPPGTGKTMAAICLAKELNKKILTVRYDQLQSMWVGQTEKHIQRIFKLASIKNAVLFFDEADAIALDRGTMEKSWEMSQVNTLLKELERFEGICIFATNFAEKYDKAFERRLTMHIDFKMPQKDQSIKILDNLLPRKSRDKNLKLKELQIEGISGGILKNIALNAAGIALRDNSDKIKQEHLQEAIQQTKQKDDSDKKDVNYMN